jgi:hypothetical protein
MSLGELRFLVYFTFKFMGVGGSLFGVVFLACLYCDYFDLHTKAMQECEWRFESCDISFSVAESDEQVNGFRNREELRSTMLLHMRWQIVGQVVHVHKRSIN